MKTNKKLFGGYSSSLVAQDFSEGDNAFHGYLLWNIKTNDVELVPIKSDYSFKNIKITPFTDFDDLDFEIDDPTEHMKVRFVWGTLPQGRYKDAERKLVQYVNSKYPNCVYSHKNEFLESEKIEINENVTLANVTDKAVQHEIFKEFLIKIGTDEKLIADVIALDEEILGEIDVTDDASIEWSIIKFGGINFMSYAQLDIDWRDMDGLFQLTGENAAGKTTVMKLITYILFGKALETETRVKFGDMRFVNNRNGADYCSGYLVLEANGEYYGIRKKTTIETTKDGTIKGAPTVLSYYLLSNPDEEMNETNSLEVLDEDRRIKTQKLIEGIIGTYDNFNRIVMTTSDTLNRILSNDMAVFIDSLLFDSGLDIFDKKLEGFKVYQKKINEKPRVFCNVEATEAQNVQLNGEIVNLELVIYDIETIKLPDVQARITTGRTYVETLTKKLFKIDPEIYNLNVDNTKESIGTHNKNIVDHKARKTVLEASITPLKEKYDEKRLTELLEKKEQHKTKEYELKLEIKDAEKKIADLEHENAVTRGKIKVLKEDGLRFKNEIIELKKSKTCPTCGQTLTADHQQHIDDSVKLKEKDMYTIALKIREHEAEINKVLVKIEAENIGIDYIRQTIERRGLDMEDVLKEIGVLTNDKNDVERRKQLQTELDQIPTKIQNEELRIDLLQQKIDNYDNSLKQIEENHAIEKGIVAAKAKLLTLEAEESEDREDVYIKKTEIGDKQLRIRNNDVLMAEFKIQEYQDMVMALYKKCVHRDGIPRQMLANYILPKINITLENILSAAPFKIWLDVDDLRPKLVYHNRPQSIIDCISASGKERTFSSVVLKFALNQINVKAKPTMFLLDEVMGKLVGDSIEEFIEILQLIKMQMKKVLIIEPNHEINPDYILSAVTTGDEAISSVRLE
jgi:DNA repair exonuclease SbcCD ATPase subunit